MAPKRPKLCPILPKKVSSATITNFFKVIEEPLVNPSSHKTHSDSFPSSVPPKGSIKKLNKLSEPSCSTEAILPPDQRPMCQKVKMNTNNFDVATYRDKVKGMKSSEIYNLIKNVFKPDKKYLFPKASNGRSFRYDWLESYSWLCYSPSKDGAFCLSCVLFGDRFPDKAKKLLNLFSEPLRRWNGAAYALKLHALHGSGREIGLHACTFPILTSLLSQISGATQPIEVILDTSHKKEIEDNRKKLVPIVDTVVFVAV